MKPTSLQIFIRYCCIALACGLIQAALIFRFQPSPSDFSVNRTISGTYKVSDGQGGTLTTTSVNGESLYCVINYLGPRNSCITRYEGRDVTVKLASYRHVFGSGNVVVEIAANTGDRTIFTVNKLMHLWWFSSIGFGLLMTAASAVVFGFIYQFFLNWRNKHGRSRSR